MRNNDKNNNLQANHVNNNQQNSSNSTVNNDNEFHQDNPPNCNNNHPNSNNNFGPGYDRNKRRPNSTSSNSNKVTKNSSNFQKPDSQPSPNRPQMAPSPTNSQQLSIQSTVGPQMDYPSISQRQNLDQSSPTRPQMAPSLEKLSLLRIQSPRPQMDQSNNNPLNYLTSQSIPRPQMANPFSDQHFLQLGSTSCTTFLETENYVKNYFKNLIETSDWSTISDMAHNFTSQFYSAEYEKSLSNASNIIENANSNPITSDKTDFSPFIENLGWFDQDKVLDLNNLLSLPTVDPSKCDLKSVYSDCMAGRKFSVIDCKLRRQICDFIRPVYDKLNLFDRKIIEKLVVGFNERINYPLIEQYGNNNFLEKPNKKDNSKILQYLKMEMDLNRVRKVPLSDLPRFPNNTFYSCRIIPVEEIKLKNGVPYVRDRFVINAVKSNELVLPPFTIPNAELPRKFFTTPSPEVLFTNDKLFIELITSKFVTIYDRQNFYRQWRTDPCFWPASIQTSFDSVGNLEYWLDISGRMGNKYSAHVAQSIVSLIDKIFALLQKDSVCLTNQDDSIIFNSTHQTAQLYRSINETLGFTFNETKTQFQVSTNATWCGYTFNLITKTIKIKEKRLAKFESKLQQILQNGHASRRDFARLIGMIWSSRLLFFGRRVLLNPALFFVRKTSKIFKNYVDEVELKNREWDFKVQTNDLLLNELKCCAEVMRSEVPIWNVRKGFQNYLQLQRKTLSTKNHQIQIHSDASLSKAGVGIVINGKGYSFRHNFNQSYLDQSINFKEFWAVILGYFMALIFRYVFLPKEKEVNFVFMIDNRCAELIALSRKAAAKNAELSVLSKCLCELERCFNDCNVDFCRISTDENLWADCISRSNEHQLDLENFSLLDGLVLMLGSQFSAQSKKIKKIIPQWLGPPPERNLPLPNLPQNSPNQSTL